MFISLGLKTFDGLRVMGCKNLQKFLLCGMCCVTATAFLLCGLLFSPMAFAKMICFPLGRYLKFLLAVRKQFVRFLFASPTL